MIQTVVLFLMAVLSMFIVYLAYRDTMNELYPPTNVRMTHILRDVVLREKYYQSDPTNEISWVSVWHQSTVSISFTI